MRRYVIAATVFLFTIFVVGLFLPSHYRVERSVTIRAKPGAIYAQINNFKNWLQWTAIPRQMGPDYLRPGHWRSSSKLATRLRRRSKAG